MDRSSALIGAAVAAVLIAGFVFLSAMGKETLPYALFVGGPLVSGLVGVLLTKKVVDIGGDVAEVRHQTNALLTKRLDSLDSQLGQASDERQQIAADPSSLPLFTHPKDTP